MNDKRASPQAEAETLLILEDDDKVTMRVVEALRTLFFDYRNTSAERTKENCRAMLRALLRGLEDPRYIDTTGFERVVRRYAAKEFASQRREMEKLLKSPQPKGPRK